MTTAQGNAALRRAGLGLAPPACLLHPQTRLRGSHTWNPSWGMLGPSCDVRRLLPCPGPGPGRPAREPGPDCRRLPAQRRPQVRGDMSVGLLSTEPANDQRAPALLSSVLEFCFPSGSAVRPLPGRRVTGGQQSPALFRKGRIPREMNVWEARRAQTPAPRVGQAPTKGQVSRCWHVPISVRSGRGCEKPCTQGPTELQCRGSARFHAPCPHLAPQGCLNTFFLHGTVGPHHLVQGSLIPGSPAPRVPALAGTRQHLLGV